MGEHGSVSPTRPGRKCGALTLTDPPIRHTVDRGSATGTLPAVGSTASAGRVG